MTLATIEGGDGGVAEPDWAAILDDELDQKFAAERWGEIVREMRGAETLTTCNAHMIARLVLQYVFHDVAARHVAEQGAIIKAKRTSVPSHNPWFSVLQHTSSQATTLEAELGISPRRRASAGKIQRRRPASRASDAYLKPVSN